MFGTLLLPDSVWNEITNAGMERAGAAFIVRADWIERRSVSNLRLARVAAQRLGLRVTGLVGVLIEARQRGLLTDAAIVANDLEQKAGFWLSPGLRRLN